MAPGWLPTIMAGPAQPCPQRDKTHQGSPQTWLVASRRTDRALYPEPSLDLVPGNGSVLGASQHSRRRRPRHQEATRAAASPLPSLR